MKNIYVMFTEAEANALFNYVGSTFYHEVGNLISQVDLLSAYLKLNQELSKENDNERE